MKLISMTDYVIQKRSELMFKELGKACCKYAQFLKQPLKLEMFVPCDEDGNVLKQPCEIMEIKGCRDCACREYLKSKEKVLFEGFEVDKDGDIVHKGKMLIVNTETCRINKTVEAYVGKNLKLTPTAIKQIQP